MYALKPEDIRPLGGTHARGSSSTFRPVRSMETAQAEPDKVHVASVQDRTAQRMSVRALDCLFCRYRSPGLGKDGTNA